MGGPLIEIYISSPRPDIFRVQARHFAGSRAKMPVFELNEEPAQLETQENGDIFTVKSGKARLEIRKNPANFSFYYKDRLLTSISSSFGQTILGYCGSFMHAQLDLKQRTVPCL
ncbi:MAG: hypothetical protein MJ177_03750 [Clostridia bacterium]|nr:hypothetical protein [Clostridia bacterium]